MRVEDLYFILCVIGDSKILGNGQPRLPIPGAQQEILISIGHLLLRYSICKSDLNTIQEKEHGMTLICYKLEMEV